MLKDDSGQLMLISAFMLAIIVIAISLTLNNVIYSSDLAYVGFMDQSRYDSLNLKDTTSREANYAYTMDLARYNDGKYFNDYVKAINNITSVKGRYVYLSSTAIPSPAPIPSADVGSVLSIYGKGSKVSYLIFTSSAATPTPTATATPSATPTASPSPTATPQYTIVLAPVNSSVISFNGTGNINDGFHKVTFQAVLKDGSGNPVKDKLINLNLWNRTDVQIVDASGNSPPFTTDNSGKVVFYVWDANYTCPGRAHIQAYADWASPIVYSNVATVDCSPPCYHIPSINTVTVTNVGGDNYEVNVIFNMGPLTNDMMGPSFTTDFDSKTSIVSPPSYDPPNNKLFYTIKVGASNKKYTMKLTFPVNAYCTTESLNFRREATLDISGQDSSVSSYSISYKYLL